MRNLLSANFLRLRKSFVFWLGTAFTLGVGLIACSTQYREMQEIAGYTPHADNILFSGAQFLPIVAAVFIGLFIGTEYSDGTIRNKILVGHTRWMIYLANLITCAAALVVMHLATILAIVAVGFPLVGNLEQSPQALVFLTALSLLTALAVCGVFLLLVMLVSKKSIAAVAAVLLSFGLLMSSMTINFRLQEPEYYSTYSAVMGEDGAVQEGAQESQPNPKYLEGTKRAVYAFLNDFLPSGQLIQLAQQEVADPVRHALYALALLTGTTACGLVVFQRKDLK